MGLASVGFGRVYQSWTEPFSPPPGWVGKVNLRGRAELRKTRRRRSMAPPPGYANERSVGSRAPSKEGGVSPSPIHGERLP